MKTILTILITAVLAAGGTWFALRDRGGSDAGTSAERKVLYYQSAMHPWIKSDKPGRCTICGMELTPVYEGDKGFDGAAGDHVTTLTQTQIQVLHVQTVDAKVQPLVRTLEVAGTIDDDDTRHRILAAYVDGRIDKLFVNFTGAEVQQGEPLADFYSPALLQAEREYRQLEGELKRNTGLRLQQMGLSAEQIERLDNKPIEQLNSQILAPISGTVVAKSVYEGQYVSTGESLFEIADFSTMWFMFRAYEQDMPWIKPGLEVKVTTASHPGKVFTGKVTFIDPNFDPVTRSTEVRVELPNPLVDGRRELMHRLYADGLVALQAPEVLSIPRSALIWTGKDPLAYVDLGGGAYEQRRIKLGRLGDSLVEVLSGLSAGEPVVTNGNLLIDGQAEMNRAFMTVAAEEAVPAADPQSVDPAIVSFIDLADAMAAALAADDLKAFNEASKPAMNVTGDLLKLLGKEKPELKTLDDSRHFHGFDDIKSARIAFHKFIVAAVAVMEPLRKEGKTPGFQIYECGMVDEAIPNVPAAARWIQTQKRKLANPFFGAEMLRCGSEIKP